jgi:hypothetical protein
MVHLVLLCWPPTKNLKEHIVAGLGEESDQSQVSALLVTGISSLPSTGGWRVCPISLLLVWPTTHSCLAHSSSDQQHGRGATSNNKGAGALAGEFAPKPPASYSTQLLIADFSKVSATTNTCFIWMFPQ